MTTLNEMTMRSSKLRWHICTSSCESRLDVSPQTIVLLFTDSSQYAYLQYSALKVYSNMLMLVFPSSSLADWEPRKDGESCDLTFTARGMIRGPGEGRSGNWQKPYSAEMEALNCSAPEGQGDIQAFLSGETSLTKALLLREDCVDVDRNVTQSSIRFPRSFFG
eukprot:gb/GECG01001521.1/.p1 GENE.gb/GECG01001521.1/~~gb/GECG01001521.1/.p1  ORF type:complete len:164 (+),score=12.12 gb/GECG01001521.1/:1-492(+)